MTFESDIQQVIRRTPSVKSFRIARPEGFMYKAGQFMEVTLSVAGEEQKKYFTISSPPSEPSWIEFTKRITQSAFSRTLDAAAPGEWIRISGPMGRFTLDRADGGIAFLSGGIGITPIHSICQYAAEQKTNRDIVLVYGNRTQNDIPFRDDFDAMQAALPGLRVVHVLEAPEGDWRGHRGRITKEIILKEIPDYTGRVFFVCGPPAMVESLSRILLAELSLPEEQVITENFDGY